ncbi:MAG: Fe-Mn family superoxide dismutase [Euryarchaeota archaeon]|nr:Fe-Mn family superoxide dismutase [Euryarchaeota archaeon]
MKEFKAQDFTHLRGTKGFSEELLNVHFKLYEGYVKNTNKAINMMNEKVEAGDFDYDFGEVRRRFGWEFNGMRLHEYYFGLMTPDGSERDKDTTLSKMIDDTWGSFSKWQSDFSGTGKMRGIGWACLAYDPWSERLFNTWLNEHDAGPLAGTIPVLLLDVFEHAFMRDYGKDKASYFKAYYNAIDWAKVNEWFDTARKGTKEIAAVVH